MIDSHTHLTDEKFKEDLDEVIARAEEVGIDRFIIPATDDDLHEGMFAMIAKYPDKMFATIGLHPTYINDNPDYREHLERVRHIALNPPMPLVAIGEVGMDLHWSVDFEREQKEGFIYQIELAIELDLPLIIHTRDSWAATFECIEPYAGKVRGVFHSFAGTAEEVARIEKLGGFYYGINGTVTYKNSTLPAAIEHIPLDKILLETDAPYLPPTPHRGKRNESSYIPLIAAKIAEIKGITTAELEKIATKNTENLFKL